LWHERSLVKTYGIRGTLHLLPAHELGLWLAALRSVPPLPRPPSSPSPISAEQGAQIVQAMHQALDGRQLTRDELRQALAERLGGWVNAEVLPAFGGLWRPWQVALSTAAHQGVLCFGPNRGNRVTYVRLDQWLGASGLGPAPGSGLGPAPAPVDGPTPLLEVVRRYVAAYGPTTYVELARWLATTPAAARDLLRQLDLEPVDVDGRQALAVPDHDPTPAAPGEPSVHLLPQFDCYVVGCHPRAQLIPASAPPALQRGTAATFSVLLLDGVVGGLWQRRRRGHCLELVVDPFQTLSPAQQRGLEQQAHRVAEILELEPKLSLGHVEPRAHL
jgi:hypothetical protein